MEANVVAPGVADDEEEAPAVSLGGGDWLGVAERRATLRLALAAAPPSSESRSDAVREDLVARAGATIVSGSVLRRVPSILDTYSSNADCGTA